MLRSRFVTVALALGIFPSLSVAQSCKVRDFLTMPVPTAPDGSPIAQALELAYPGVRVDDAGGTVFIDGKVFEIGAQSDRTMRERILNPTIQDQFLQVYPLEFDLSRRNEPWFDPGRVRHDGMLRALYGDSEGEVAENLVGVEYRGATKRARFAMNTRHCVAQQLQAALDAIAADGSGMDRFFSDVGGSFNWRVISGTDRLSAHSFGMAVDFDTGLGGYWRWSGESEGRVGHYENRYPEALVRNMERFGFIWGGKWHHYDGMHFEYRPELILYARQASEPYNN